MDRQRRCRNLPHLSRHVGRGEAEYTTTTGAATSFVYTGTGESAGQPPTAGTKWVSKNLLELKNAQRSRSTQRVREQLDRRLSQGYAIVLTPRNTDGTCPWSAVRDVTSPTTS